MDPTVIKCKQSPRLEGEPFALIKRCAKVRRAGFMGNHDNARRAAEARRKKRGGS